MEIIITNLCGNPQRLKHSSPEPFVQLAEQLLLLSQRSFDHSYCFYCGNNCNYDDVGEYPWLYYKASGADSTTFFVATSPPNDDEWKLESQTEHIFPNRFTFVLKQPSLYIHMQPDITLYTASTPNGWKVSICLEELGVPYTVKKLNLASNEQKSDAYLSINPNGRIPAIIDHTAPGGDLVVWESGSILLYLAEKYHKDPFDDLPREGAGEGRCTTTCLLPQDPRSRVEVMNWLFWQVGGLGPMQGQADWWAAFSPDYNEAALQRYLTETQRLYGVMEKHFEDTSRRWLVGDAITIADIACFPWIFFHDLISQPLTPFYPNMRAWVDRMLQIPSVVKGLHVPEPNYVLNHNNTWKRMLNKAADRLKLLRPIIYEE
jgi:glutathione S-transferase